MRKYITNEYEKKLLFLLRAYQQVKRKEHQTFKSVSEVAIFFEVSAKHLWELNKRFENTGSVLPRKRGPKIPWNKPPKELERIVVFIKRKTTLNNYQISKLLISKGYQLTEKGVGNILKRYPAPKRKEKVIRYEKENPGDLGHIDVHKLKNVKGENPKKKKYIAALEDDCTRIGYFEILNDKKASTLRDFTERALNWFEGNYLISFKAILSDNGKEFTTHWKSGRKKHDFEVFLKEKGIIHKYTRPYRPQTNGKVEAFWKIIEKDVFKKYWFNSWKDAEHAVERYLFIYNSKREHGGINRLTPEEKLIKLDSDNITELSA